jgi:hypothetical protein
MPFNILNKKIWLSELDLLTNTYIDFLNKVEDNKEGISLDLEISKKYKSNDLIFTGQEIIDNIQGKLAGDNDFIYEFRVVDNKPTIRKKHRISFDNYEKMKLDDNSADITTIEDLKSKYVEALIKIDDLNTIITKKETENRLVFLELVDALGGIYQYASKKKLILTLSKILKELKFYDSEIGTQYSFEKLSEENKSKVVETLYNRVYK